MVPELRPNPGEKIILEEDCAETNFGTGILTLTNQRLIFEKTEGTLATLSKKIGNVLLNVSLEKVKSSKTEGFIITKVVIDVEGKIYKFGVFNSGKWAKVIKKQKEIFQKNN